MLTEFSDLDGLEHNEFIPSEESFIDHFYMQCSKEVERWSSEEEADNWQGQWLMHHVNTTSHTLLIAQKFPVK
jgi:hypothetical protein